jgi:hypothetical protein
MPNWQSIIKNPVTSWAGVFTALGALADAGLQITSGHVDPGRLWLDLGTIAGGLGLVGAKDAATHSTMAEVRAADAEARG